MVERKGRRTEGKVASGSVDEEDLEEGVVLWFGLDGLGVEALGFTEATTSIVLVSLVLEVAGNLCGEKEGTKEKEETRSARAHFRPLRRSRALPPSQTAVWKKKIGR